MLFRLGVAAIINGRWSRALAAAMALFGAAEAGRAQSPPASLTATPAKGDGSVSNGTAYTRLTKPISFDAGGLTPQGVVRIFTGDVTLAQGVAKKARQKFASSPSLALGEGSFPVSALQTVNGLESPPAQFLTIVVDRTPPAAPGQPDLATESDTGVSTVDNVTGATALKLTGTGEPGATALLFAGGKAIKSAAGIVDPGGAYTIMLPKAKAGVTDFTVGQTDRAGNVSIQSAPLRVTVLTKPPKAPTALELSPMDRIGTAKPPATGTLRPTIIGLAVPGALVKLKANLSDVGSALADGSGMWAITTNADMNYGAVSFTATQTDLVGKESTRSKALIVNVLLDNAAPAPGTDGAVFVDDFNDDSRSDSWKEIEPDVDSATVSETNKRLEVRLSRQPIPGRGHTPAGYIARGWALDLTKDFRLRANWRFAAPRFSQGDAGLSMGLILDGTTTTGEVFDGVTQVVGARGSSPFAGFVSRFDDEDAEESLATRSGGIGTLFMWYVAADDRLRMSRVGFSDPNAQVVFGVRSAAGVERGFVFLGGWVKGVAATFGDANAFFDNVVVEQGTIVSTGLPSEGGGAAAAKADDFDDNTRGPDWQEFSRNSQFIDAIERNKRLELRYSANLLGVDGAAGWFAKNWSIDLTQDFRLRVDRRFPVGTTGGGDLGLTLAVVVDGSTSTGQINEGLILFTGADTQGPYSVFVVRRGGALIDSGRDVRDTALGTIYLRFEAATNRLYFSGSGYNDANARFMAGLRTSTRTKAIVYVGGFTAGAAPGVSSGAAWFDNLSVDRGMILNSGLLVQDAGLAMTLGGPSSAAAAAPNPDLNGDGIVDSADVAALVRRWGERGTSDADLDEDGVIGAGDLRALIERFGSQAP